MSSNGSVHDPRTKRKRPRYRDPCALDNHGWEPGIRTPISRVRVFRIGPIPTFSTEPRCPFSEVSPRGNRFQPSFCAYRGGCHTSSHTNPELLCGLSSVRSLCLQSTCKPQRDAGAAPKTILCLIWRSIRQRRRGRSRRIEDSDETLI